MNGHLRDGRLDDDSSEKWRPSCPLRVPGTTLVLYHAGTTRILSSVRQFVSFPYYSETKIGDLSHDLSSLCKAVDIRRSLYTYGTSRAGYRDGSCAASIISPAACRLSRAVQGCHVAAVAPYRYGASPMVLDHAPEGPSDLTWHDLTWPDHTTTQMLQL
jgi:hypothetical protein